MNCHVKTLSTDELNLLFRLFDYNDPDEMIVENARDIAEGKIIYSVYSKKIKLLERYMSPMLRHLQENDRHILELLSSQNNDLFLRYFKSNLKKLIVSQYAEKGQFKNSRLPEDYLVNHMTSSFVETVSWWISHNMKESPEQLTTYFLATIEPIL